MKLFQIAIVAILIFSLSPAFAQDDAEYPQDDSVIMATEDEMTGALTDSDIPVTPGILLAPAATNPIAFGVVYSNGSKQSGTANWSSTFNPIYKRYEIKIVGENYYYLWYATNVTPAGDIRFCKTSSVGGKLLIYCYDKNSNPAMARFGFATFKSP